MTYYVDGTDFSSTEINEVIEYCISDDYHEEDEGSFEDWVNETYNGTTIEDTYYSPYDILSEFGNLSDVIGEYCTYANNSDIEEANYELRHANVGDIIYIQGYEVHCYDDSDSDEDEYCCNHAESIEELRERVETELITIETAKQLEEKNKRDYLDLFQMLGD